MAAFISYDELELHWPSLFMQANTDAHYFFFTIYLFRYYYFFFQGVAHLFYPFWLNHFVVRIAFEANNLVTLVVEELQAEPASGNMSFEEHVMTFNFGNLVGLFDLEVHV